MLDILKNILWLLVSTIPPGFIKEEEDTIKNDNTLMNFSAEAGECLH